MLAHADLASGLAEAFFPGGFDTVGVPNGEGVPEGGEPAALAAPEAEAAGVEFGPGFGWDGEGGGWPDVGGAGRISVGVQGDGVVSEGLAVDFAVEGVDVGFGARGGGGGGNGIGVAVRAEGGEGVEDAGEHFGLKGEGEGRGRRRTRTRTRGVLDVKE